MKKFSEEDEQNQKDEIEKLFLSDQESISILYRTLALLFPSEFPHPNTFEYNIIDDENLKKYISHFKYELQEEIEGNFPNQQVVLLKK